MSIEFVSIVRRDGGHPGAADLRAIRHELSVVIEVMMRLSGDDKCPCESERVLRNCCLKLDGELRPVAAFTRAPAPKTSIRNKGCYAAALADCSPDISREHFVSHGLLKLLSIEGKITIDGFPWQDAGAVSRVPPATLNGKILCSRHNSHCPRSTPSLRDCSSG